MNGIYNAVSADPVSFEQLINQIALARGKSKINFPIPKFMLQLMLDGFGSTLVASLKCSTEKMKNSGFEFQYPNLKSALDNLLRK